MKKHWLRGVLLGVSLALLLAGGVALAQGLSITPDKECFECEAGLPGPENIVEFKLAGRTGAGEWLHFHFWLDGEYQDCWQHPNEDNYYYLWAYCDDQILFWDHVEDVTSGDASPSDIHLPFGYGEWTISVCPGECEAEYAVAPAQECAQTTVVLAEDCSAFEFVPEPGTILLLGSGLTGLAGYAALRLRSGEPPRWRTRE